MERGRAIGSARLAPRADASARHYACPGSCRAERGRAWGSARRAAGVTHICQAFPDRVEVRGRDLTRRPHGPRELHRLLPPARLPARAERRPALLPRPPARGDRRARDDAHQRRGAHDARRRPGFAAGRRGGRDPRLRPGHPRHVGVCARLLVRRAERVAGGEAPAAVAARDGGRDPRLGRPGARLRPPGAPSARPARRAHPRARRRPRCERPARGARARVPDARRRGLGQAADDERLDAHRRRDARPGLPAGDGEGDPPARPHRGPARPPRRGAGAARSASRWRRRRGGRRVPE